MTLELEFAAFLLINPSTCLSKVLPSGSAVIRARTAYLQLHLILSRLNSLFNCLELNNKNSSSVAGVRQMIRGSVDSGAGRLTECADKV